MSSAPSQVEIKAFYITKENSLVERVEPGQTITAMVEEVIQIKVPTTDQEQELSFTWYTCGRGDLKIDDSQLLYAAPGTPGQDCIRVVVRGKQSVEAVIFVEVQQRS